MKPQSTKARTFPRPKLLTLVGAPLVDFEPAGPVSGEPLPPETETVGEDGAGKPRAEHLTGGALPASHPASQGYDRLRIVTSAGFVYSFVQADVRVTTF